MRSNRKSYRSSFKRKKNEPNAGQKLTLLLLGSIFAGFISGFAWAYFYPQNGYGLFDIIGEYLSSFPILPENRFNLFTDSLIKYGKLIAAVWFMAFLPIGALLVFLILLFKGFSLGFTAGALITAKGFSGAFLSLCLSFPQNIVLIPVLLFMGSHSVRASLDKNTEDLSKQRASQLPSPSHYLRGKEGNTKILRLEYLLTLLIGMAAALLIALYEAYAALGFLNAIT